MLLFHNGGRPEVYLSSADLLPRNFYSRVETIFPILAPALRKQLQNYFEFQWRDNVKARVLDPKLKNEYRERGPDEPKIRSQEVIEQYLREL